MKFIFLVISFLVFNFFAVIRTASLVSEKKHEVLRESELFFFLGCNLLILIVFLIIFALKKKQKTNTLYWILYVLFISMAVFFMWFVCAGYGVYAAFPYFIFYLGCMVFNHVSKE